MCWMCDHPDATFGDYVDEVLQPVIDRCGWAVQGVAGSAVRAPFSYTVGLTLRGMPELVVTGKPLVEAGRILNGAAQRSLAGPRALARAPGFEVVVLPHPEAHLFVATGLFGEHRVRALQLVWADEQGAWPWDAAHRGRQPVLGPRNPPARKAG